MGKLKKSTFIEGAFIATACIIISKILGIVYVIPFYKIIGEQGGALYGYAYNIYNVFYTISVAGIPFAICKLTSEYSALGDLEKKVRLYRLSRKIILWFSLFSFLVCFVFSEPIAKLILGNIKGGNTMSDVVFVIRSISFTLLIVPLLSVKRGYLQGHKYISQYSLSQVIEQFARIVIILGGSVTFVYVLKLPVKYAVGISVSAAGLGALVSYFYLTAIVSKNRGELSLNLKVAKNSAQNKEIAKDIFVCAVPFIIINLANTLYNSTDMVLVLNTLPKLGFSAHETEFVSSVFTTWGTKFNAIISAVSTGLIVSLIPHIVSDYTKGDSDSVNLNFNKCLKIVLLIILPMAFFISVNANSCWTVFYGRSETGPRIIKVSILVTVFDCLYMVINSLLQSLNKRKIIYLSVIAGLVVNLVFDIPFMYFAKYLGLSAYYGAIIATLFGFLVSNTLSFRYLKKHMNISYSETLKTIPRVLLSLAAMFAVMFLLKFVLPTDSPSRLMQIVNIAVTGVLGGGVYIIINRRQLGQILPEKIAKKLRFI